MSLNRRDFIVAAGLGAATATLAGVNASERESIDRIAMQGASNWEGVRERFNPLLEYIHDVGAF